MTKFSDGRVSYRYMPKKIVCAAVQGVRVLRSERLPAVSLAE